MNHLFILSSLPLAQEASGSKPFGNMLLLVGFAVVLIVFMYLPQRRKQREIKQFRSNLKQGDKVVTIGGLYGKINEVKEDTVLLKVADNTIIKLSKAALSHAIKED